MLHSLCGIRKGIPERKSTVQTLMLTTAEWEQVLESLESTPRVLPPLADLIRKVYK